MTIFKRKHTSGPPADDAPADERRVKSKVLPRFLAALAHNASPVILDLGPVVGSNIAFFGDRLACKIHVEDIAGALESSAQRGDRAAVRQNLLSRYEPASIDGVLCWDVFDFLDRKTSQLLAGRLVSLLRSGGALHGCFGTSAIDLTHYTRYLVDAPDTLRARPYPASTVRRHVLTARDLDRFFEGLAVAESVLLKSSSREMLFRKP